MSYSISEILACFFFFNQTGMLLWKCAKGHIMPLKGSRRGAGCCSELWGSIPSKRGSWRRSWWTPHSVSGNQHDTTLWLLTTSVHSCLQSFDVSSPCLRLSFPTLLPCNFIFTLTGKHTGAGQVGGKPYPLIFLDPLQDCQRKTNAMQHPDHMIFFFLATAKI